MTPGLAVHLDCKVSGEGRARLAAVKAPRVGPAHGSGRNQGGAIAMEDGLCSAAAASDDPKAPRRAGAGSVQKAIIIPMVLAAIGGGVLFAIAALREKSADNLTHDDVAGAISTPAKEAQSSGSGGSHTWSSGAELPVVHARGCEAEYDFGYVKPAGQYKVILKVQGGNKTLKITKTRSDCRCITVENPPTAIPPGKTGEFLVKFAAPNKASNYSGSFLVVTDEPKRSVIVFRIKAQVGLPLAVAPAGLDMGQIPAGREARGEVTLINRGDREYRPIYSTSTAAGCNARIPRAVIKPRGRLVVPIVVRAARAIGKKSGTVSIRTDNADQLRLDVRVEYEVISADSGTERETLPGGAR